MILLLDLTGFEFGLMPVAAGAASPQCGASDSVGKRLPVLFVHGFNSSAKTWSSSTLARFCTDRTYSTTFDYGPQSNEWVTNPNIGPALARRILNLADMSRQGGGPGKVMVIAHSMGGLAVRCAADGRCNGDVGGAPAGQASQVAQALAGVVTFDTPNTGSFLRASGASLFADTLGAFGSDVCYVTQASNFGLNDLLNNWCDEYRTLVTSHASRGFTPGSGALKALPAEPRGVPVLAVAGKSHVHVHLLFATVELTTGEGGTDAGDLIVSTQSALAESVKIGHEGGTAMINCGTWDLGLTLSNGNLTCDHLHETNNKAFLDQAQSLINAYLDDTAARDAPWTAPVLLITPTHLGAVRIGMKQPEAEAAAHARFSASGDGQYVNDIGVPLDPHGVAFGIDCFGASAWTGHRPTVITEEGFHLGDTIVQLKKIYGSQIIYYDSERGYAPAQGYILHRRDGVMLFNQDPAGTRIVSIQAGPDVQPGSAC